MSLSDQHVATVPSEKQLWQPGISGHGTFSPTTPVASPSYPRVVVGPIAPAVVPFGQSVPVANVGHSRGAADPELSAERRSRVTRRHLADDVVDG